MEKKAGCTKVEFNVTKNVTSTLKIIFVYFILRILNFSYYVFKKIALPELGLIQKSPEVN